MMTKQERVERKAANAERAKRMFALLVVAQDTLRSGVCPECGTKLYRNLALSGWWQCGHFGGSGFQREVGPTCHFQFFFDPSESERIELMRLAKAAGR